MNLNQVPDRYGYLGPGDYLREPQEEGAMEECNVHRLISDVAVQDSFPPRSEMAHRGWMPSVLKKIVGSPIS